MEVKSSCFGITPEYARPQLRVSSTVSYLPESQPSLSKTQHDRINYASYIVKQTIGACPIPGLRWSAGTNPVLANI